MTQGQAIVLSTVEAQLCIDALEMLQPDDDAVDDIRHNLIRTLHLYIKEEPPQ